MSKLSEKQLLVGTILVTVLLAGGLVALILTDRGAINDIEGEIGTIEAQIRACDGEIRKTPQREEDVLVFRAVETRELAILPTQQMIVQFLNNLSSFFASSGVRFEGAPESSPAESQLAKGIFETHAKLRFRGPAASILKFMNMVENDPRLVAIKGYDIGAGDRDEDDPLAEVEHDVNMTMATYFYNPAAGNVKRVHIPNEQRRLQDAKIRAAIDAFEPERPDTYVLRPSASRRDPFVDPRKRKRTEDPAEILAQFKAEEVIVSGFEAEYTEIAEKVEAENALLAAGDLFRADRLGREIDQLMDDLRSRLQHAVELKTVTIPELLGRLETVQSDVSRMAGNRKPRNIKVTAAVSRDMLDKIQELFNAGEYTQIGTEIAGWESYVRGKEVEGGAHALLDQVRSYKKRAKDLSDFRALKLHVGGTIIDETDPSRSVALINRSAFKMGDRLDDAGEIVVGQITPTRVTLRFRNEVVHVPVGRRRSAPGTNKAITPRTGR